MFIYRLIIFCFCYFSLDNALYKGTAARLFKLASTPLLMYIITRNDNPLCFEVATTFYVYLTYSNVHTYKNTANK